MGMFREAVYHDEEGVITMTSRQFGNKIDRNDLPPVVWYSVRHKLPRRGCWERFSTVTEVAAF